MSGELVITVHGTPAPQGSKRHVGRGIMVESSKKVKPWREAVKHAAIDALFGRSHGWRGAVTLDVVFYLPRPRGHFGSGRNADRIRDAAPLRPRTKPDLDKLLRSTLDALTEAGAFVDDSQVVGVSAWKQYADARPAGAQITVRFEDEA